jgi:Holliday junction resolvase RusA-like endonuclease
LGKHSRRGDLDNILGSILDALVQSGILPNDNAKVIVSKSIQLFHSKDDPVAYIKIDQQANQSIPEWGGIPLRPSMRQKANGVR